jgi:hypothetical protein
MMAERSDLLAVCGLYCGACYHHRASFPESRHLLEAAARQGRELEGFTCRGCRSGRIHGIRVLYIHPGCAQCEIRACADERGVLHCGLCLEFPCARIEDFRLDGHIHHLDVLDNLVALKGKGPGRWLAEQEQRWTCKCGKKFSWYETACRNCGASLASYGPDPRAAIDTDA